MYWLQRKGLIDHRSDPRWRANGFQLKKAVQGQMAQELIV
jgi:hypothetical protein